MTIVIASRKEISPPKTEVTISDPGLVTASLKPHQNLKPQQKICTINKMKVKTEKAGAVPAAPKQEASTPVTISYGETQFRQRYQRNNKRGGLKNLRCFPTCAECHKERGFCGRSVVCVVNHPKLEISPLARTSESSKCGNRKTESAAKLKKRKIEITESHKYMCRAEFVKVGEPGLVNVGDVVTREFMASQDRSKAEPTKPWVEGDLVLERSSTHVSVFEFNKDRKGWHYGWASNKHTCNAKHCLLTYVFERNPKKSNEFTCINSIRSPSFMLYCRRRRRFVSTPSAPIAPPLKRSKPDAEGDVVADKRKEIKPNGMKPRVTEKPMENSGSGLLLINDSMLVSSRKWNLQSHRTNLKSSNRDTSKKKRKNESMQKLSQSVSAPGQALKKRSPSRKRKLKSLPMDVNRLDAILSGVAEAISKLHEKNALIKKPGQHRRQDESGLLFDWSIDPFDFTKEAEIGSGFDSENVSEKPEADKLAQMESIGNTQNELDAFSKSIEDCMDFFSAVPEMDLKLMDPSYDEMDHNGSDIMQPRSSSEVIVADLAQYLLHEKGFTESIHKLSGKKSGGASYQGFLDVLQRNLEGFMRKHNLTVEEFDQIFGIQPSPSQALERKPQGFFGTLCEAFVSVISPAPPASTKKNKSAKVIKGPNNKRIPNHSGKWKRDNDASEKMMELRNLAGIPWLLGKMFEYMESEFEIQQKGLEMECRLRRKLLSNGTMKMLLDGTERPFGLKLPILSALSRTWTCQAFSSGETISIIHTFGSKRLIRISWMNADESLLHSRVVLETYDDILGTFIERMHVQQVAHRIE